MEVISPVHGKITYDENEIIKFEKTILGFDELHNFILRKVENILYFLCDCNNLPVMLC